MFGVVHVRIKLIFKNKGWVCLLPIDRAGLYSNLMRNPFLRKFSKPSVLTYLLPQTAMKNEPRAF